MAIASPGAAVSSGTKSRTGGAKSAAAFFAGRDLKPGRGALTGKNTSDGMTVGRPRLCWPRRPSPLRRGGGSLGASATGDTGAVTESEVVRAFFMAAEGRYTEHASGKALAIQCVL